MIKDEEYEKIPTRLLYHNNQTKYFLKNLKIVSEDEDIFSKFRNITIMTDEECFRITRWNRLEFMNFRRYITSIYDTAGRTCEELIAIYRFWLRKGGDQTTLSMLKKSTNQQKISHFLAQIRTAIYKDFVPFFWELIRKENFICSTITQLLSNFINLKVKI
jgi:hypothetical protein